MMVAGISNKMIQQKIPTIYTNDGCWHIQQDDLAKNTNNLKLWNFVRMIQQVEQKTIKSKQQSTNSTNKFKQF